jgi:peroxiredoxin
MTPSQLLLRARGAAVPLAFLALALMALIAPLVLSLPAGAQTTHGEPQVRPDGSTVGQPPRPEKPEPPPLQVGDRAPDFTLSALRGKRVALADFKGQVVLLDFWATWCPSCRNSVQGLKQLRQELAGRPFTLVSITEERDRVMLREFVTARDMDWPQAWDEAALVSRVYRIKAFPTYLLLGPDGRIVHIQTGWGRGTAKQLRAAIEKALATGGAPTTAAAQPAAQRR